MAKAIVETSPDINLNISTNEIVQANVDTCGVLMVDQYRLKRICTETDNRLQAIMKAHLVEQASHYTNNRQSKTESK